MRILLTGGGTAGHINPALAIAETVQKHEPTAVIEFVGVKGKREEDLIPRAGYRLHFVRSKGIESKLPTPSNLKAVFLAVTSPFAKETQAILDEFQPDLVIGTGGYACWPIMLAASRRGIPTALHESNSHPGKTVRALQGRVDRIWTNFAGTADRLRQKKKVVCVGNPLRGELQTFTRKYARRELGLADDRILILSFGGSGGARSINGAIVPMMRALSSKDPRILHVHSAGKLGYEETMKRFCEAGLEKSSNCIVRDYIYDMPLHLAAADLVISRSGAMTVSELAMQKKTCILIPFPDAAYNHQYLNAKELADEGAAILFTDQTVRETPEALAECAKELLKDPARRAELSCRIAKFADPSANERIWNDIQTLIRKK